MSSASEESVDSEVSSPYQSDGEVQCSFTKRYSSTGSEESVKDSLDFGDTYNLSVRTDIQNEVTRRSEDETDWIDIFPRGAEKNLNPDILARIKLMSSGKETFVYISYGLMNILKSPHKVLVPNCVIRDVCIVPHGGPIKVLTFVRNPKKLGKVCEYNSHLTRVINTALRNDMADSVHIVHGVVDEREWMSESLFKAKIDSLETTARHQSIPYSLDNSESRCMAVIQTFLKLIYSYTDVADIYESSSSQTQEHNFVMTTAYYKALDIVKAYRHLTLTGGSGEGKTTIGRMLCQEYQTRGYKTFFYDSFSQADVTVISEVRVPFLLVVDNVFDNCHVSELQSFLTAIEEHVNSGDVILVLVCHLYNLKQVHKQLETQLLTDDTTVDITNMYLRNPGKTRCERYQLMKAMHTNLSTVEMIKICSLFPNVMGFPKICAQYAAQPDPEPILYFSYPHGYFVSLLCMLLKEERKQMAALALVIMNGGKIELENFKRRQCQHLNSVLHKLQNLFHFRPEESIVHELECLIGTFLKHEDDVISFQNSVIFDACVFVINKYHPYMLWKHCKFTFTENTTDTPTSPNIDILISQQNLSHLLHDLWTILLKRQFRILVSNPLLTTKKSAEILFSFLQEDLQHITNSVDVGGRGNFLYWTTQSQTEWSSGGSSPYLVEMVIQHSSMADIHSAFLCCIHSKEVSVFSYLWGILKIHRPKSCDINEQDEHGKTYLLYSVEKGDAMMVDFLIHEGSDPLVADVMGNTALHIASRQGSANIVKLLLSITENSVNTEDVENRTPVMLAAASGNWETFEMLANVKSCDLTCVDINGDSALHLACLSGSKEIVKNILSHKSVDINKRDKRGRVPLIIAASEGHGELFELLIKAEGLIIPEYDEFFPRKTDITKEDCILSHTSDADFSLIHRVSRNGHLELLEFLLSGSKIDVNTQDVFGRTPLMEAARAGHKGAFDLLISKGASLLLTDDNGCTLLHFACEGGNTELIKNLQAQSNCLHAKDGFGKTPVMHAVENGQHSVFKMVVEDSDLSVVDVDGNTMLHLACRGGSLPVAEYLIMTGSFELDTPNKNGETPVMIAAYHESTDICHMLIDKGCDLDKTDFVGNTVLSVAVKSGNVQSFADILDYSRLSANRQYTHGKTLSMIAAVNGKVDVLKFLMDNGYDLTITDDEQNSVLHLACCAGEHEIVEMLVQANVDLNSRGNHGRTALMVATERGFTDICDLLINEACSFYCRDDYGNTILHIACLGGYQASVEYVLSMRDLDINVRGQNGKMAVTFAVEAGQSEMFGLLVSKGCDLDVVDDSGNNLLHAACIGGSVDIVKYLLMNGSFDLNGTGNLNRTPVMFAACNGHLGLMICLVQRGCDMSLLDAEGNNIFHIACQGGHTKVCHFLLYLGIFDINETGKSLRTPAMVAAYMCHTSVFDLLTTAGCDLTVEDKNGDSVLHMACLGGSCGIVSQLLSKGFSPDQRGRYGRTPVMLAACRGHSEVYHLLVNKTSDLSGADSVGNNLLHMACRGGNVDIVEHVLSLGIFNVNSTGQYGRTAVMVASGKGHKEVVRLLMGHGCDLKQVDRDGNNTLHIACLGGNSNVVKYLLECNIIDIKEKNNSRLSAKKLARYSGYDDICRLLQSQERSRSLG